MAEGNATNCVTSRRQHQLRAVDAKVGAVRGGKLDDGVHAVDVEEVRNDVIPNGRIAPDALCRSANAAHSVDQRVLLARLVVGLLDVLEHGHGECHPPGSRDHKGDLHGRLQAHAKGPHQHKRQAGEKRHAAANIAPRIALARDFVHTVVRRGVNQQRVIEHERRVERHGGDHVNHEKRHCAGGEAHGHACHGARPHRPNDELLLHALLIGNGTQDGHEQCDDQRGHGLCIAPGDKAGRLPAT